MHNWAVRSKATLAVGVDPLSKYLQSWRTILATTLTKTLKADVIPWQSDFPALAWHLSAIPISNESCSTGLAEITKSFSTSTGIPSFRPVAFLLDNSLIDFCDPSTTSSEFRPCQYAVFPECFAGGGAFAPWCIVGREERRLSWRHMVLILERVFKNDKTQDETILHITQLITPTFYNCHQSFGRHWTTQHLVLLSGAQNVPLSSTLAVHSPSWLHRSKSL